MREKLARRDNKTKESISQKKERIARIKLAEQKK